MRKILLLMSVLCISATLHQAKAQTATFKALFLYNFTKNINWPQAGNSSELVITVLGDDEIKAELEKIAKVKKAGNKTIKVVSAKNINEIGTSHIIFLGSSKSSQMASLSAAQANKSVLLVADKKGLCSQGAAITFLTVNGKLRYEISPSQIKAQKLEVTQKIVSLGISVD